MDPIITDEEGTLRLGDRNVRRMGYGAMRLSGDGIWGPPADRDAAVGLLRDAVEWGVNLIDTADAYGPHTSEELIADALHPYPDDLVIATKGGVERPSKDRWPTNGHPDHLRAACDGSLRRLHLEALPLYQLHAPDPSVPLEDSVGALAELRERGKVRQIGLSNVSLDELRRAQQVVEITSVQNRYSLLDRQSDDVVDACEADGLVFLPYFPLGAGRVSNDTSSAVAGVAERLDVTAAQVALAWLLHRSPVIAPIPGTSDRRHLAENLDAAHVRLTEDDVAALAQGGRER